MSRRPFLAFDLIIWQRDALFEAPSLDRGQNGKKLAVNSELLISELACHGGGLRKEHAAGVLREREWILGPVHPRARNARAWSY